MVEMSSLESLFRTGWERSRQVVDAAVDRAQRMSVWGWLGVLLCGVLVIRLIPLLLALLGVVLVVGLVLAWVSEFVTLMRLAEADFPGRHDKLVWTLLMLVLPPLGLLAFWTFRRSHWPDGVPVSPTAAEKPKSPWSEDEWN